MMAKFKALLSDPSNIEKHLDSDPELAALDAKMHEVLHPGDNPGANRWFR
jgi:hypothetical protein